MEVNIQTTGKINKNIVCFIANSNKNINAVEVIRKI